MLFEKKLDRRNALRLMGLMTAGAVVAACAPKSEPSAPTAAPGVDKPEATAVPTEQKYTILHWAQGAEPTDPSTQLAEGEVARVGYQTVADAYKDEHPNVDIEWYRFPAGSSTDEWLLARMTAQDSPDIYWSNTENLWPHLNKGWALDFTEYMNQPNPYVSGNERWVDQFQDVAVFSQTGPDGKLYGVNMDGAGVLTVYNKDAFAEAGITEEPVTWGDYLTAWQKLLDAGYIPFGADCSINTCCFPHWFEGQIYNQFIWDSVWDWDDDDNKLITGRECVEHFQKGDYPNWEAYTAFAQLFKQMVPYLPMGFEGVVDYRQLFRQGKVAMYFEGNWAVSQFKASPPPFEFSWLQPMMITKDIWAAAPEKIGRIQGAWGAMQYHVPGYLAESAPDRVGVIMDWLMFSSKPENVTTVLKETGMVPLTKGATGMPELAPFAAEYDRAVPYQSWTTMSPSAQEAEYTLWQEYLPTDMSTDEFRVAAEVSLQSEVDKLLEANPDWKVG